MRQPSSATPEPDAEPRRQPPRLRAEDLLRDGDEIEIQHGADVYRLRLTRNGKLILTK